MRLIFSPSRPRLLLAATLCAGALYTPSLIQAQSSGPATSSAQAHRSVDPLASFAPLVEKVAPSVVTVFTSKSLPRQASASPYFYNPGLRRFFGEGLPEGRGQQKMQG